MGHGLDFVGLLIAAFVLTIVLMKPIMFFGGMFIGLIVGTDLLRRTPFTKLPAQEISRSIHWWAFLKRYEDEDSDQLLRPFLKGFCFGYLVSGTVRMISM